MLKLTNGGVRFQECCVHETFAEGDRVEEHVRRVHRDQSVHADLLRLRVAPDAPDELTVLLRGPQCVLDIMALTEV